MHNELIDFLSKLEHCEGQDEVWNILTRTVGKLGYNVTSLTVLPKPGELTEHRINRSNYNYDWHKRILEKEYFRHDGFIKHCQNTSSPTYYDTDSPETLNGWNTPTGRVMLSELGELGVDRSLCVPMINNEGLLDGALTISSENLTSDEFRHQMEEDFPTLFGILTRAYQLLSGSVRGDLLKEKIKLSPRQFDILMLLGEGRSNKQIAHKLEIKEVTVSFHLTELRKALGCKINRQIVPKAYALGLFGSSYS